MANSLPLRRMCVKSKTRPLYKLAGRAEQIWKDRDAKLEAARERGQGKRAAQKKWMLMGNPLAIEHE